MSREWPVTHWLWRLGVPVTRLSHANRYNGQTCLTRDMNGNVSRVGVDQLQTTKEFLG